MKKKHAIQVWFYAFFWGDIHTKKRSSNTIKNDNEHLIWHLLIVLPSLFLRLTLIFIQVSTPHQWSGVGPDSPKAVSTFHCARRNDSWHACDHPDPSPCEPQTLWWEHWKGDSLVLWTWKMNCVGMSWA